MYSRSKYLVLALCLFLVQLSAKAQDQPAISTIMLQVQMPAQMAGLPDQSVTQLANKLAIIVTNNGLATTDKDAKFIITPTFTLISNAQAGNGGIQKFYAATGTLTLFVKQVGTGTVFKSFSKNVQGTGDTKEQAVAGCINSISPDNDAFSTFITDAKAKIVAWYQQNCQSFMTKAQQEIAQKHYDAAQKILDDIPQEAGDCYADAQKKIGEIFTAQYGNVDKAEASLQQAAIINPNNMVAQQKLVKVKKVIEARNAQDKNPPEINLLTPPVTRGQGVEADVKESLIYVSGNAKDPSGIASVTVNGKALEGVRPDGFFQTKINSTETDIVVQATDKRGNTGSQTFHIESKKEEKVTPDQILPLSDGEKFHAIFIANSNYTGTKWPALKTTVDEAKSVRQLLIDKYGFAPENIDTVFNKGRMDILTAISNKMQKMTDNDNLILFYGGHGYFIESTNMAYWVPLNAETEFNYISNSDISNLIATCQARHILVMADACFSGAMRGGLDAPSKYEYKFKSRQLLTSGGTEPVPGKSAYVQMIMEALNNNQDKYVSARELYTRIAKGIMDQTKTEPTIRDLNVAGSMGGQFYFKKN